MTRTFAFASFLSAALALGVCARGLDAPAEAQSISGWNTSVVAKPAVDAGFAVQTFDVNIVLGVGQSTIVGAFAPITDSTQPFSNTWLHDTRGYYDLDQVGTTGLTAIPLVGGVRSPTNNDGGNGNYFAINIGSASEDPGPSLANQLTSLTGGASGLVIDWEDCGQSGASLAQISDGGTYNGWDCALWTVTQRCAIAAAAGKTCGVTAMMMSNGQADAGNTHFASDLHNFQSVLQSALQAITSQSSAIPMWMVQQASTPFPNPTPWTAPPISAQQQQLACDTYPASIRCTISDYTEPPHVSDGQHHTDYRISGEVTAEYINAYLHGTTLVPTEITGVTCTGTHVATFAIGADFLPLVFDTSVTAPHLAASYYGTGGTAFPTGPSWTGAGGFALWNGNTPVGIVSATIVGSTVVVVGASAFTIAQYGFVSDQQTGAVGGAGFGWRGGTLRNSNTFTSYTGTSPNGSGQSPDFCLINSFVISSC